MKEELKKTEGKPQQRRDRGERREREDDGFKNQLICVRRVTKVVKGGRTMRFSAAVAVGDGKGNIGFAVGKAAEVPQAIEKATQKAKKNMKKISVIDNTIPHEHVGKFSTTKILMFPAKEGTGIIAGGAARAVIELAGIRNIVTKIHGSSNKINTVKATIRGLTEMRTREEVAALRGIPVEQV